MFSLVSHSYANRRSKSLCLVEKKFYSRLACRIGQTESLRLLRVGEKTLAFARSMDQTQKPVHRALVAGEDIPMIKIVINRRVTPGVCFHLEILVPSPSSQEVQGLLCLNSI